MASNGYRDTAHGLKPINMVVIDVDSGDTTLDLIDLLLSNYTYFIHTTKRHTPEKPRFRLVLPLSHILKFNPNDYREFMQNIFEWLPFDVDSQTADYCRKWASTPNSQFKYKSTIQ